MCVCVYGRREIISATRALRLSKPEIRFAPGMVSSRGREKFREISAFSRSQTVVFVSFDLTLYYTQHGVHVAPQQMYTYTYIYINALIALDSCSCGQHNILYKSWYNARGILINVLWTTPRRVYITRIYNPGGYWGRKSCGNSAKNLKNRGEYR